MNEVVIYIHMHIYRHIYRSLYVRVCIIHIYIYIVVQMLKNMMIIKSTMFNVVVLALLSVVIVSVNAALEPPPLKMACSTCRTNTSITFKWIHKDVNIKWYEIDFIKTFEYVQLNNNATVCPIGQLCGDKMWTSFKIDEWNTMRTKQDPIVQPTVGCSVYDKNACSDSKNHTKNLESSTTYTFRARSCSDANTCSTYSNDLVIASGQNAGDMPQGTSMFCSVVGTCTGTVPHVAVNGQQVFLSMENEFDANKMKEFFLQSVLHHHH